MQNTLHVHFCTDGIARGGVYLTCPENLLSRKTPAKLRASINVATKSLAGKESYRACTSDSAQITGSVIIPIVVIRIYRGCITAAGLATTAAQFQNQHLNIALGALPVHFQLAQGWQVQLFAR